jgi:hypothetical protein
MNKRVRKIRKNFHTLGIACSKPLCAFIRSSLNLLISAVTLDSSSQNDLEIFVSTNYINFNATHLPFKNYDLYKISYFLSS